LLLSSEHRDTRGCSGPGTSPCSYLRLKGALFQTSTRKRKSGVALAAAILAVAAATAIAAIAWSDHGKNARSTTAANTRITSAARTETTVACQPWSECSPDAAWLRRVLRGAGFGRVGPGTGSALVIPGATPAGDRFLWAVRFVGRPDPIYRTYRGLPEVDGVSIYTDGTRLLWQVQRRNVYLEPPPERTLVARLVRLTIRVRAPIAPKD